MPRGDGDHVSNSLQLWKYWQRGFEQTRRHFRLKSFAPQTGQNSHQFSVFFSDPSGEANSISSAPAGLSEKLAGVLSQELFLHLARGLRLLDDLHGVFEKGDRGKIAPHKHLAFAHHLHRKADLFRAPKRRSGIDEDIFLILVEKTLGALVTKSWVQAVFQGEIGAPQVGKDKTEVGKTIQRAAQHQAGDVDGRVRRDRGFS